MTATAGQMLLMDILPLIRAAISRGAAHSFGGEDIEELTQDCLVSAAQMLASAESRGKPLLARSTAHFAIQRTKTGRRSTSAGRVDVLAPTTILDGNVLLEDMDAPLTDQVDNTDDDECCSLHDTIASSAEDPGLAAARRLDWQQALSILDSRKTDVLRQTACGVCGTELAVELGVSTPRICQLKHEIGNQFRECWGVDSTADVIADSAWSKHIAAFREHRACKYDRKMAARAARMTRAE